MKILYSIHQFFPKYYTGTEKYLFNLATMMQKLGHEVRVITYDPGIPKKQQTEELQLNNYIFQGIPVTSLKCKNENDYTSFDLTNNTVKQYFSNLFQQEKPDIFHITHPMRMTSAFWAAKELNLKTVITLTDYWLMCGKGILLRNDDSPCLSPKDGLNCKKYCYKQLPFKQLESRVEEARRIFKKADALIASAKYLVELFKYNKYDVSRLKLIRHGFNYFDNFTPINSKPKKYFSIVSTGSLLPHKGAHLLIEAFKKIKNKTNLQLKIYGTTYGNASYMKFLEKLKDDDKRISFEGAYSVKDTAAIHQDADLIVQPSLWFETYPLVCVAALVYGVPIVVPDLTGASELVQHGQNGFIFKFGDANSLAEQLSIAIDTNLKKNKVIFYPQSIESEAIATEKIYYQVLNSKK